MTASDSWMILGAIALGVLAVLWMMGARRIVVWILSFVGGVVAIGIVIRVTRCAGSSTAFSVALIDPSVSAK